MEIWRLPTCGGSCDHGLGCTTLVTCYVLLPSCDICWLKYEFSAINLLGSACFSVVCHRPVECNNKLMLVSLFDDGSLDGVTGAFVMSSSITCFLWHWPLIISFRVGPILFPIVGIERGNRTRGHIIMPPIAMSPATYYHCDVILSMTSFARLAPSDRAHGARSPQLFSLWGHSHYDVIRYWAGHALGHGRTYVRRYVRTAFNT